MECAPSTSFLIDTGVSSWSVRVVSSWVISSDGIKPLSISSARIEYEMVAIASVINREEKRETPLVFAMVMVESRQSSSIRILDNE